MKMIYAICLVMSTTLPAADQDQRDLRFFLRANVLLNKSFVNTFLT
jgi:hypothetical protein